VIDGLIWKTCPEKNHSAGEAYRQPNKRSTKGPKAARGSQAGQWAGRGNVGRPQTRVSAIMNIPGSRPVGPTACRNGDRPGPTASCRTRSCQNKFRGPAACLDRRPRHSLARRCASKKLAITGCRWKRLAFNDLTQTRYDIRGGLNVDNGFLTKNHGGRSGRD